MAVLTIRLYMFTKLLVFVTAIISIDLVDMAHGNRVQRADENNG